jgi:acetyltransferase
MTTTAKLHFPPESFQLADGRRATIRAIRPSDAPLIQTAVTQLSPESSYYRFLAVIKGLSDAEAARMASVDYEDSMALVATLLGDQGEQIIAVARYARLVSGSDRAEFAVVVGDPYQKQGLARMMLKHIAQYAREHGIYTFTGTIDGGNLRMREFVQNCGLPSTVSAGDHGELEVEVFLGE